MKNKLLFLFTFLLYASLLQSQEKPYQSISKVRLGGIHADSFAKFRGGYDGLIKYIEEKIDYAKVVSLWNVEGDLTVEFIIDTNGIVSRVYVTKPARNELDNIVQNAIKDLPKFIPASLYERKLEVSFGISFQFRIDSQVISRTKLDTSNLARDKKDRDLRKVIHRVNSLKLGLADIYYGHISIYYERRIVEKFSLEFSVGITFRNLEYERYYSRDKYIAFNGLFQNKANTIDVKDLYIDYSFRSAKPSFCFSIAPKYYIQNIGLRGIFVSSQFEWKNINYSINQYDLSNTRNESMSKEEFVDLKSISLNMGYQALINNFTLEFKLGGGIMIESSTREDIGIDLASEKYINGMRNINQLMPKLNANIIIGWAVGRKYYLQIDNQGRKVIQKTKKPIVNPDLKYI